MLCVCAAPLCAVGLAPAGHRVADARAGARVHVLHHDEGMLLQRRHGQVPVVGHLLQEAAVPGPDGVPDLEDPPRVCAHLETGGVGGGRAHVHVNHVCLHLFCLELLKVLKRFYLHQLLFFENQKPSNIRADFPVNISWIFI